MIPIVLATLLGYSTMVYGEGTDNEVTSIIKVVSMPMLFWNGFLRTMTTPSVFYNGLQCRSIWFNYVVPKSIGRVSQHQSHSIWGLRNWYCNGLLVSRYLLGILNIPFLHTFLFGSCDKQFGRSKSGICIYRNNKFYPNQRFHNYTYADEVQVFIIK